MFTMFFLVKLTIAIVIVCGILSPILASPHNKLSTLFWKIPNAFWIFLICIYFAIAMAVLIESSEQTGNDSNLLIVFYVQIMPDDFVMQLHRF